MSLESVSARVFEIRKSYAPTGRIGNAEPWKSYCQKLLTQVSGGAFG